MKKMTPMMEQYFSIKEKHPTEILFFRMGDFYEMFYEDAILASKELEIALTARASGNKEKAPMCGVPFHSAQGYIVRLIKKGYRVAICEQTELPQKGKTLVNREVVRIITPGTLNDEQLWVSESNQFLCALHIGLEGVGLSAVDITTGEWYATRTSFIDDADHHALLAEIYKYRPVEILISNENKAAGPITEKLTQYMPTLRLTPWVELIETEAMKIFEKKPELLTRGEEEFQEPLAIKSSAMLLDYLFETQKMTLSHLKPISFYHLRQLLRLDATTRKNLELTETLRDGSTRGSLFWVLNRTKTAMGARLLKQWIEQPLLDLDQIKARQNMINGLISNYSRMLQLKDSLKDVYDYERLLGKLGYGNFSPKDFASLRRSFAPLPQIRALLLEHPEENLLIMGETLDDLSDLWTLIQSAISDDPPFLIKDGGVIRQGYSPELDEIRSLVNNSQAWLIEFEAQERERTGIKSLKVKFNKVFGYYIEITKSNLANVPLDYHRKQTLVNAERFITPELNQMEDQILGAEERALRLEQSLIKTLQEELSKSIPRIQKTASQVARLDSVISLATVAREGQYVRPEIKKSGDLRIENGRHPVIEKIIGKSDFIANHTLLNQEDHRMLILTGPNMAGKSTYMRQVALITLMAQLGSYVPADSAEIPLVDQIFTRIGASDDLAQGQSTFMVEMNEVANILSHATASSLVILDEIGRGTSTYDGLSIAWAVVEYLSNKKRCGAKTLFATHYHELSELEEKVDGVKNYKISVKEDGEQIYFTRKISRGSADKSYGIEVAKLAGVPNPIIHRAKSILQALEESDLTRQDRAIQMEMKLTSPSAEAEVTPQHQEVIEALKNLDTNQIRPIEALVLLDELIAKCNN
jgi:DNA mismatch repair protein MutS